MNDIIEAVMPGGRALAIGVGVGVALLMTRSFRPLAKQAVKGYIVATEGMRRVAEGAREGLQDIYAEAKAEQAGMERPAETAQPSAPQAAPQPAGQQTLTQE
ncbi:MAG: DUF5132 domain-containing protein [Sphingomonadaceae bacterium]